MALYEICGGKNATQIDEDTRRNPQTIMEWVHRYNDQGLEALIYQRTGGRPPFSLEIEQGLDREIRRAIALSAIRW